MDPLNPSPLDARWSPCAVVSPPRHKSAEHPSLGSSRRGVSTPCSPALTSGHLAPSHLEAFQALLQSSQVSAGLCSSIQRLRQEAALMGVWGSSPLEPRPPAAGGGLCSAPADSPPGVLSAGEQPAGARSSAAQARLKWDVPFAKNWSLGTVTRDLCHAEPLSVPHRCGHIDWSTQRTNISGDVRSDALAAGVGFGRLVGAEADSSGHRSPSPKCQPQVRPALDTGGLPVHTRSRSPAKALAGEEAPGGAAPHALPWERDLPAGLRPAGLRLSLETHVGGAQMNVGVAMYGTPQELCLRVTSPSAEKELSPAQQLGVESVRVHRSEPRAKPGTEAREACGSRAPTAGRAAVPSDHRLRPLTVQAAARSGECSDAGCAGVSGEGRRNKCSHQSGGRNWGADADLDQPEEPRVRSSSRERRGRAQGTASGEVRVSSPRSQSPGSSFWPLTVPERSPQQMCDRAALATCFQAWRGHVLWKRATARWQEVAQQRRALALLTISFCRWKEATAKQSKKRALQPEPCSCTQSSSAGCFGVGRLATMTTSAQHQLTAGYSKEAEQACRVEGGLWTRLRRGQREEEICWRAQAIRDVRRLAAAFRLWHLHKELLSREEARLSEARALLEVKQLRNLFWLWRSRCVERKRDLALATQIQRNFVSRCFCAWKEAAEREALCRRSLVRLRAASLGKCFQQWVQTLQLRGGDKQAMVNILLLQWRWHCGQGPVASSGADRTWTKRREDQLLWAAERWFPERTGCSLDDLCQKVKLQRVHLLWKARLGEHRRAHSFSQALEQRRLRKALKLWHQKCLVLETTEQSPEPSHRTGCEESLAAPFAEELSTSSGFDSNASATLASQSSLEKEHSCSESSQQSLSSLSAVEDIAEGPCRRSSLRLHRRAEPPAGLAGELCLQTCSAPRGAGAGRSWLVGGQFQPLALQSPDDDAQPRTGHSAGGEGCGSDEEMTSWWPHAERRCLQSCFTAWAARTRQLAGAQQRCRLLRLSRAFLGWNRWVVENKNRKAAAALNHRVCCCRRAFSLWKGRWAQKVEADRRFRAHVRQAAAAALRRWRSRWQGKRAARELQRRWAQQKKRLLLQTWRRQARKQRDAALFRERLLLHRCLLAWAQVTARRLRQREALSGLKRVQECRLLRESFAVWKGRLWRAKEQLLSERNHKWQEASRGRACHRWRLASRGRRALRLGAVAAVKQSCNYWTRAAAFSQCRRQRSTPIGARKSRKMSLSWPLNSRRGREEDSAPADHLRRIFASATRRWLLMYRSQTRVGRLLLPWLVESPGAVGASPAHAKTQETQVEADVEEWAEKSLGRKYLRWWHHTATLRWWQRDRRLRCLARGWHRWREASGVVALARVLDQQRLMEKAWRAWRRRHLQSRAVQNFLEAEARSLLSQAFGRWRQLTALQLRDGGRC